jgi:membrane-associated phospholipid phosphatase
MPPLLRTGMIAFLACIILVLVSYYYLDKPIIYFVAQYHLRDHDILKQVVQIRKILAPLLFVTYLIIVIRFCYGKFSNHDKVILAIANSMIISYYFCTLFKYGFGRYWPASWFKSNPSLLRTNDYGFNWFHGGHAYASFPSGHTTIVIAAMTIIWIAYPRWRWFAILFSITVIGALLVMYYHFLSDIIAGIFLGWVTAFYTAKISGVGSQRRSSLDKDEVRIKVP